MDRLVGGEADRCAVRQDNTAGQPGQQRHIADRASDDRVGSKIFGVPNVRRDPVLGETKALRPDAAEQLPSDRRRQNRAIGAPQHHAAVMPFQREQVHRRRPDEAGGETGRRPRVDFGGWRVLLDTAVAQQHDLVGHAHGLGLIVRHVQHGDAEPPLQRQDFAPHIGAELRIEVRQRFVHQADRRLGDDGATECHALLLAAGELARLPLQQVARCRGSPQRAPAARPLWRRNPARLQPEHDVLRDAQMREQGIGLEHHRNAARGRRQSGHVAAGDLHPPLGCRLQSGNDAQAGGLAAARRAQQNGEAAGRNIDARHRPVPLSLPSAG